MRYWDATPPTGTVKLVVSYSNKWVIIACLLIGLVIGCVLIVAASVALDDRRVSLGLFEHNGKVYKLTEFRP